jgi:hypothetical protein
MTTTMTTDQRQRIVLLEQRQQLRQAARQHEDRLRAELSRFHEDLARCEVLFADRMELEAIPSFRDVLATMAARWHEAATESRRNREGDERLEANEDIAIATTLRGADRIAARGHGGG